jgi:AraC-like DNA-binding protein
MQLDVVERTPPPELAAHVARYSGYSLRPLGVSPIRRREIPTGMVTVILTFDGALRLTDPGGSTTFSSFVAGVEEHAVLTEYDELHGMQLDLPPLGAYRLFGLPMSELANTAVELDALDERPWSAVITRLAEAPSWEERFALLDDTLLGWAQAGPAPDPAVAWALQRLQRSGGLEPVGALAAEIGWSRRHFGARFRAQVGMAPKATASVLRFRRAVRLLGTQASISDVAAATGYADHSHLTREFRRLAGCTPSEYLAG